ncbi:hypothetical protein [Roseibium suaedae]|uniref:Uncharacterized protein n=1 Tax=Roseibium suaedae TaxID=735517 RepID=A0A1M7D5G7_9HYPH|nr:hypothetical protein [Roseibium suaedae]SHL74761.1 hypothetical protein SAMN05444272_1379 [Roseibium suaedae]
MTEALSYRWTGAAMIPAPQCLERCQLMFEIGSHYSLEAPKSRTKDSHRHYFACVNAAWQNLPEDQIQRFPSPEHLRKWALVHSGYADETTVVCDSQEAALKVAALARKLDGYAVITCRDCTVRTFTARAQTEQEMDAREFQKSKEAVLSTLARLIGADPVELSKAVRIAA